MFAIWFLIGAALVFFMQCGFAMVESGFTRAKSAGNIIMKNLMDFCIGSVVFMFLGFGLMMSQDYVAGIIGIPNLGIFTDYGNFDYSNFVFQLVFCATAATIVSGAMAERTKFSAYCIYSGTISAVVYPIEAGWIWNENGWLNQLGFVDFAGSAVIHTVGGTSALIGAIVVGARIGKYSKTKSGKVKSNAIPGHSLTLGALGVFILWFGWYGFNGAAATTIESLGSIFLTTTLAAGAATVVCMILTWIKDGKPDVGMCLNASLAGLVAITAPCASVDAIGALIIGLVAGVLVDVVVEFLDKKLHIDDPVGAVGVHMANGIWGTLSVGLFATGTGKGAFVDGSGMAGLFYGGGFKLLGIQALGVGAVVLYTIVTMTIVFLVIKHTIGLRASAEDEIVGMDISEHGLSSAYADFMSTTPSYNGEVAEETVDLTDVEPVNLTLGAKAEGKFTKITIICPENKFGILRDTMDSIGVTGMTVSQVMGCGVEKGHVGRYKGVPTSMNLYPKVKVEIVVSTVDPGLVVAAAQKAIGTEHRGSGKIFVSDIEDIMRVRTGETGYDAMRD
ncbi:MAG: ammonium transporter [Oscillospiraceae bacterium]|nr:ammonium transporter [Oscillospiraceae bacterium]